jgi:hypothetical protein
LLVDINSEEGFRIHLLREYIEYIQNKGKKLEMREVVLMGGRICGEPRLSLTPINIPFRFVAKLTWPISVFNGMYMSLLVCKYYVPGVIIITGFPNFLDTPQLQLFLPSRKIHVPQRLLLPIIPVFAYRML